jgi:hypothetical protein
MTAACARPASRARRVEAASILTSAPRARARSQATRARPPACPTACARWACASRPAAATPSSSPAAARCATTATWPPTTAAGPTAPRTRPAATASSTTARTRAATCGDGTGDLPPGCVEANGDAAGASCFSDCTPHRCGDGLREGLEACEGADLQDLTCEDVGFYAGDLACDDACRFDTTACSGSCGDGEINGPEFCEEFVEGSCVLYGLDYGRPDCNALCGISLSACGTFATPEVAQAFNDETVLTTAWSDGNVVQLAGPQYLVCTGICLPVRASPGLRRRGVGQRPAGRLGRGRAYRRRRRSRVRRHQRPGGNGLLGGARGHVRRRRRDAHRDAGDPQPGRRAALAGRRASSRSERRPAKSAGGSMA